jgi:hypothetical protein
MALNFDHQRNRISSNTETITINNTGSIRIPSGTTFERPNTPNSGEIRFNSTLQSFEGYVNTNWTSLGGVKDVDGNTYIIAETAPGANNNDLDFYTNGSHRLQIDENGDFRYGALLNKFVITNSNGNTAIAGTLGVTGQTTLASANISDLTNNRITYAGTSGELQDSANLTFNGSTLALAGTANVTGQFNIDNIRIDGNAITSTNTNGNINITPNGTGDVIASKLKVSNLTSNRIIIATVDGELDDDANLTFDATTFAIATNKFTVNVSSGNTAIAGALDVTGSLGVDGSFDVATNKFTVNAASGNTAIAGTLDVTSAVGIDGNFDIATNKFTVNATSGNTAIAGILDVTGAAGIDGNFDVATNKFTVNATTGNTAVAGTLDVTGATGVDGNFDVATNKFTVNATTGNTLVAGTLDVNGATTVANLKVSDLVSNRLVYVGTAGRLQDNANLTFDNTTFAIATNKFTVAVASGDTAITGTLGVTGQTTLASASVTDLTANRVVYAGSSGELQDSANLTFNGSTLALTGALTVSSSLTINSTTLINSILDEDNMASNSATALATQQSIKAYVDSASSGQTLSIAGTSGTGTVNLSTQTLTIAGTTNEIEAVASGQTITVGLPNDVTIGNNLIVTGNLTVNGTTTTVNSTVTTIDDPVITLGGDTSPSSDDNKDRGIEFRWHNGTSAKIGFFGFDDSTGKFTFIPDATNTSEVFSGTKGTIDANVDWSDILNKPDPTITLAGDLSGSVTLTDLANGTLTATITANSVALGTDTTGNYVASITNGSYITGGDGGSEGAGLTLAVDATSTNTSSKVVARDSSGNFAAGTITAALSGNASTATTLATARTIAISGDVTGTATSFNGSADITISAGITADSIVNADINSSAAIADTKLATISTAGKVSNSATTATSSNTNSAIVARDSSGNFTAGTITAALSGNASTASSWANSRTITLGGDLSGNVSIDGSANVTLTATIVADSVALGTDTTGNYVASITNGSYITGGNGGSEGAGLTLAVDATSTNTASKVVARDSSGNFAAGTITAALSGNATTATTLATSRTISLGGDLSGSASFNGSADITITATIAADSVALGTDTTGNYVASLVAGTGVTLSNNTGEGATPTIAIGQDVSTTANVTFNNGLFDGNVTIDGNLSVGGTTTTTTAANLSVTDNMIYMNQAILTTITNVVGDGTNVVYTTNEVHNYTPGMSVSIIGVDPSAYNLSNQTITAVATNSFTIANTATGSYVSGGTARARTNANPDLGFAFGYYDTSYQHGGFFRDASDGYFKVFKGYTPEPDVSPFIDTSHASFALADIQAANFRGALVGNASTATTLATARNIAISGDVTGTATSFNGSADITISAAITADSIVNADINSAAGIVDTKLATISTAGKVSNSATTATSSNTNSAIVARDSSGNFSAGTVTAALSGNATTATTLQTARNIAISGDVTGTATSFNGSADITISAAITADSIVNADINSAAAIADTKLATISTAGKVSNTATTATNANTANAIVARDASGNFTAGTITAALSGNATTATTLQTARNIGGVSFDGSANIDLPGVNTTGNQNTTGSAATLTTTRTLWGQNFNGSANVTGSLTSVTTLNMNNQLTNTIATGTAPFVITSTTRVSNLNVATAGNADTLTTARNIAISGDVTGTATSFNGSADITISAAITADSIVNADINSAAAIADTKLATISTAGKVSNSATTATSSNTNSAIVARDSSGNFTAGTITAALSGNATTATTLQTTRTLWGQNFDGSANVSGNLTGVGNITGSSAITITAGGSDQNITLTPTGTGYTLLNGNVGINTSTPAEKLHVDGAIRIDSTYNLDSATATLATVTQTSIASFSATTFGGGKVVIQARDTVSGARSITEMLIVHNGTTASATQYAMVNTGASDLAAYDVDISSGNVRILATQVSTNSTQYKIVQTLLLA